MHVYISVALHLHANSTLREFKDIVSAVQLDGNEFGQLFHSPLSRAARTAEIIWGSRSGPVSVLPSLREVDLYSFQVRSPPHCCGARRCAALPPEARQGCVHVAEPGVEAEPG